MPYSLHYIFILTKQLKAVFNITLKLIFFLKTWFFATCSIYFIILIKYAYLSKRCSWILVKHMYMLLQLLTLWRRSHARRSSLQSNINHIKYCIWRPNTNCVETQYVTVHCDPYWGTHIKIKQALSHWDRFPLAYSTPANQGATVSSTTQVKLCNIQN